MMAMKPLVPSGYFVTSATAVSKVSDLNAFDLALLYAKIGEQNLVAVSSVIPEGAEEVGVTGLPTGAVTFCVLSQMRGRGGEVVSAGIAYAERKDGRGGYVAEGHLHGSGKDLRGELEKKMREMSRIRDTELGTVRYRIEELRIPENMYGCALSALVFTGSE